MNATPSDTPRRPVLHPLQQRGFTLIEMMISVTIGLGILAGLVGVLSASSGNSRSNDRTAELMSNGRYALNAMKLDLREAGFRGYTWAEPDAPGALGALVNECLQGVAAAGSFVSNIRQGVWGFNNGNPFTANCIPTARFAAGNDVLVVRRLMPFPATVLNANTLYFQSTYERGQMYRSTAPPVVAPVFGGTPAPLGSFAVQVYVYYISPSTNVLVPEVPAIPSLRRLALSANGTMVDELVASGIEHLQVQFGYFETDGTTRYFDAGVAPLDADSSTATASGWDNVNSVRIWLLARNTTGEPGLLNTQTYSMGGQDFAKSDAFRRQSFSSIVQLRN